MNRLVQRLGALALVPAVLTGVFLVAGAYYLMAPGVLLYRILGLVLLTVAAVIVTSVAAAYRIAGDLRDRIAEMRLVAQQVGKGTLGEKIYAVQTLDELGLLAQDLNDMLSRISQRLGTLGEEKTRADTILNHLGDGVLLVSPRMRVVYANPACRTVLDLERRVVEGRFLLEVISNSDLERRVLRALQQAETSRTEVRRGLRDETILDVQIAPVQDGPRTVGALLVIRDVSRARKLERARAEFVANASHELQTPLTAIRGFAETLLDGAMDDPESARRFVEIIQRESVRLSELVDELLDLSKIESGKLPVNRAAFSLAELTSDVVSRLEMRLESKRLTLTRQFPPDLPQAYADRAQIARVMLNLLDNAVKYTPAEGRITVGAQDDGTHLTVFVSDSGIGIPEGDQERIFERFYRVDKARSRESGGTGLGLSIVKHLVERNGGSVSVESHPGAGSHFHFTLPKAP